MAQEDVFKKIVSHCKEYGFVFPSSEIYDGLAAVYDYGQNGVELKNNIKQYWWQSMVLLHENIVGLDAAIFMHPTVWKASGHVDAFNDPLIDNRDSKKRYRADVLIEDHMAKYEEKIAKEIAKAKKRFGDSFDEAQFRATNPRVLENQKKFDDLHARYTEAMQGPNLEMLKQIIEDEGIVCPISGTKNWTDVRQFNLMFSTQMGAASDATSKVDDVTSANVEILVHLAPGTSSDKTMDALYAFSDCEINISPNCCVIEDNKPVFLTISDVLRHSVDRTMGLLRKELMIRKGELEEQLFFSSLERIFIEERIYKERKFEQSKSQDEVVAFIDSKLEPFKDKLFTAEVDGKGMVEYAFHREITREDILKLLEIKMQRILKYNKDKADELLMKIKAELAEIENDLAHMTDVTINWFEYLKGKYGKNHPRKTEIRNFDTIEVTKVVEANQKLYINRQEGFVGTGLKKDEFVCNCSDLDDIIIFYKDGKFKVTKVADKIFVGKNILHVQVFKKNDKRTIYNCVYRDGKQGDYFIKRFNVTAMTRDKLYDITQGTPGSRVIYFTANPNGEAEIIKCTMEPDLTKKRQSIFLEKDFSDILIKGRAAKGNLLTKRTIRRIGLKSHGHSTLGGRKVWFDPDVNRINYDENGRFLGEFNDDDSILVVLDNGEFYITNFDVNNHYEDNIIRLEKWDEHKIWTAILYDADNQGYPYIKRFTMDATKRHQNFMGENPNCKLILLTDTVYPRIKVTYGGVDAIRPAEEIDAEQFIAQKSFKAKGKRLTTFKIDSIEELEPTRFPEPPSEDNDEEPDGSDSENEGENLDPDAGKSEQQVIDELTGQTNLFSEKDFEEDQKDKDWLSKQ
jgi:topoisomerase IV subunit A